MLEKTFDTKADFLAYKIGVMIKLSEKEDYAEKIKLKALELITESFYYSATDKIN